MSEVRKLRLDQIHVPVDRIQPVLDEDIDALAAQIREDGQRNAIGVYRSSASKTGRPYTLIYGARRYRAMERLGIEEISVVLRKQDEALKLEIQDNLDFVRHDVLREAAYLSRHRSWWELKHGKVRSGQPRKVLAHKCANSLSLYFNHLSEAHGIARDRAKRLHQIELRLSDELKDLFRNTKIAGNLGKLLKCAKLQPEEQMAVAVGLRAGGTLEKCLNQRNQQEEKLSMSERLKKNIALAMSRLTEDHQDEIMTQLGFTRTSEIASVPAVEVAPVTIEPAPAAPDYEKALASRAARRKPREKPARDPAIAQGREAAWFGKTFIEPLAKTLASLDVKRGMPLVTFCKSLRSEGEQFIVACELGNGHDLRDAEYRIERYREEPEREWEAIAAWKLQNSAHHKSFIKVVARYAPRAAETENLDNEAVMQQVLAEIPDLIGDEEHDFTPEEFQGMVARLHPYLAKKMLEARALLDRNLLETVLQLTHAEQIYVAHDVPGVSWRGEAYRRAWEILEKKHMGKTTHPAGHA